MFEFAFSIPFMLGTVFTVIGVAEKITPLWASSLIILLFSVAWFCVSAAVYEPKYQETIHTAEILKNGTAIIALDGGYVNLNEKLGMNIEEGTKIRRLVPTNWSLGIYWKSNIRTKYEVVVE